VNQTSVAIGRLLAQPELLDLARSCAASKRIAVSGLWGSSVGAVVAAVRNQTARPVLVVCGHIDEGDELADDLILFGLPKPDVLPTVDIGSGLGRASEEQVAERMRIIARLVSDAKLKRGVMVAPVQSIMQSVPTADEMKHLVKRLGPGMMVESEKLITWLVERGYNRLDQVEVPGDFAVRGGIIDIYLPESNASDDGPVEATVGVPIRIDFFGDQIDTIRKFDPETLGNGDPIQEVEIFDIAGRQTPATTSLLHLLPPDAVIVFVAPMEIAEQGKGYLDRVADARNMYPLSALLKKAADFTTVELSPFDQSSGSSMFPDDQGLSLKLPVRSAQKFERDVKQAMTELAEATATHQVAVFCDNDAEAQRFGELLEQHQPQARSRIAIEKGYLHRGFAWENDQNEPRPSASGGMASEETRVDRAPPLAHGRRSLEASDGSPTSQLLIGHHELFNRFEVRRKARRSVGSKPIDSFLDLQVGDYVVHVAHGIAKFVGIQTVSKDGRTDEMLTLRFADSASLHVPASRINLVQKYVGGFSGHPPLSKLGGTSWEKQKEKVSEAVMDMAADLLEVQAQRQAMPGIAYPGDTPWQSEFEAEFPYTPTVDQVTCSGEIKQDMTQPRPMDRLLCGDVGYGKTELAMRAAFKAIEFGKQVAVLVPTTVLAEQHERSFRDRFADYPFRIDSISRFKSGKESREIAKRVSKGEIDILIGTHRILSEDIRFADLGLVIVDEEQRFGVQHKEKLKRFRATVDMLTMSATPIPRTLHMGMVGLRDISSLTTPPQDRRAIVTEVCAYDPERVKLAMMRELAREGQIYYVHNRIEDILDVAKKVEMLAPGSRILVGHGQMDEHELEDVMLKFIRHEADILVCTTIIESGLDIPNANTMIIDNADMFGLSQLHQLRGRVGRYKHRAYCYLLLPPDRPVTQIAAKRLKAIEEYSHLGSGFKIAMRDLEIRGAGNILGPEQSGHIASVGYELYCQLLEEAVHQLKTGKTLAKQSAQIDLGVSAFIPKSYIQSDRQRMEMYRRLSRCSSVEDLALLQKDMADAFGEVPRTVQLAIAMAELKLLSTHFGISTVIRKDPDLAMVVEDASKAQKALTGAPGRLTVVTQNEVYLRVPPTFLEPDASLLMLRNLMMKAYEREKRGEPDPLPTPAPQPSRKTASAR
jgi:transcription-repair coupling factor (superfamily II helicase)